MHAFQSEVAASMFTVHPHASIVLVLVHLHIPYESGGYRDSVVSKIV